MLDLFKLPVGRYSPADKNRYSTVVQRNIISTLSTAIHELDASTEAGKAKLAEGKEVIAAVSKIKHQMGRNQVLEPIPDDGQANRACYNDYLATVPDDGKRWFTMDWLFAECYLYRLLRSLFATTQHWQDFDPFFDSKSEMFRGSAAAVVHLAKAINAMVKRHDLSEAYEGVQSPLEIAFLEMAQADLWGNATDLSLLTNLTYDDLQKLQAVGAAAQAEQAKYILRNDLGRVWELLKSLKGGRVDIVLDNAGFELYTDFVFADFLLSCTPFVSEVVFHPKTIPWFVSDVVPFDFEWTLDQLTDPGAFFGERAALAVDDVDAVVAMSKRWRGHLTEGRFRLSVPLSTRLGEDVPAANFWTTQFAYQDLPAVDPALLVELRKADLVVFKGDLNYRKLIGDAKWDPTAPFEDALGPLYGQFALVSFRTNKADTICGLPAGVAERLDAEAKDWRTSGKYAVVSFAPRASGHN